MAALHKFNPVRLAYIRDKAAEHFGRDAERLDCLQGIRVLDIGCGGGILSEPLARLGARDRVGADPSEKIAVAKHMPRRMASTPTIVPRGGGSGASRRKFDIVLAMEVVEHVVDVGLYRACGRDGETRRVDVRRHAEPTLKSFALAIVGAEYVLRWLPRGTHRWDKFVTPNELELR